MAQDGGSRNDLAASRRLPRHVAIIMDGNGRWAASRGMPRVFGHRAGVEAVRRAVKAAREIGLETLTVFGFSSENWSRPPEEISELMMLLRRFLRRDLAELHSNNVRVRVIGERSSLEPDIRALLVEAEDLTHANTGLTLVVAFNYGARDEIVRAARQIARDVEAGLLTSAGVNAEEVERRLETAELSDPDLIIRTSGEQRLSNFLLWQAAYAEFVFLPIHWPDFDERSLSGAIDEYMRRERRFGGLKSSSSA
jgi:undecaprenyl diphosphate synthase